MASCVGISAVEDRSMITPTRTATRKSWNHDFVFRTSACTFVLLGNCPEKNNYHKNVKVHVYEAHNHHRIMMTPGYHGTKQGWTYMDTSAYFTHYFIPRRSSSISKVNTITD